MEDNRVLALTRDLMDNEDIAIVLAADTIEEVFSRTMELILNSVEYNLLTERIPRSIHGHKYTLL